MNPRHAAALALVGWYLIMPPADTQTGGNLVKVPIKGWRKIAAYDTEAECRNRRTADFNSYSAVHPGGAESSMQKQGDAELDKANGWAPGTTRKIDAHSFESYIARQCVASDDPSLKEK
jgi:hypothetical protein